VTIVLSVSKGGETFLPCLLQTNRISNASKREGEMKTGLQIEKETGLPVMKIKAIGRKLGKIALKMAPSGCGCAGGSGSSACGGGNRGKPQTIEPHNEKEGSVSKEAVR